MTCFITIRRPAQTGRKNIFHIKNNRNALSSTSVLTTFVLISSEIINAASIPFQALQQAAHSGCSNRREPEDISSQSCGGYQAAFFIQGGVII